jgi:DNA-binding CsgD family transcriptional regulator
MEALEPFGISYYAAWIAANPTQVEPRSTIISNWPIDWADAYLEEKKYLHDPVVTRATSRVGSFFWHELDGTPSTRALELRRDAQHLGMIDGFTISWRSSLPTATILSLAGAPLHWQTLEREAVSAIADSFILRAMALRRHTSGYTVRSLSPQERRILCLAATGLSDNHISETLGVHRGTVLSHWARIRTKLRTSDRTHSVAIGIRSGEIGP